jgi:two-component system, chemotaxis family, chemotaxis protein CheY
MNKCIMVVDDSATIRVSVSLVLKEFGMPVEEAENGAEALKKMQNIKNAGREVALYITDVNMPVMDGITFVKELRKQDTFSPILMLTTESGKSKIDEGREAGVSGWIIKPFKTEQFISAVRKLIK